MATVQDVLRQKGTEVFSVSGGDTVFTAVERMAKHGVGCLVVTQKDDVCGIITERDYLRKVAVAGRSSKTTKVAEIMSAPVVCASPEDTIEQCMAVMTAKRCRHLPVVGEGRLVGLVSIGDLVKHRVADQKYEIRFLQDYIQGRYPG